ncbi:MAG: CBS domain-containing protein, partial [Bacillus sp. (in: firmicutes)]
RPRVGYYYKGPELDQLTDWFSNHYVHQYKANPIVIKKSVSVYDAIVQIFLMDVGTLYAVNQNGHLAGVISRKDLLRASIGNRNLQELPVNVIMTRMPNVITIKPEATLLEAARKMIDYHIDSLPVVQEIDAGEHIFQVVGRVTKTTITRAFIEMGSH